MLKALLKKQFLETVSFFLISGKSGKRRNVLFVAGIGFLILYALGASIAAVVLMAREICAPLVANGLTWVYFTLVNTLCGTFGVVVGALMAKSKLFEAKDNETLLAMPVPAWAILFTRMLSLYLTIFFFSTVLFLPAVGVYFSVAGWSFTVALACLALLFLLPLGTLAISAIIGWLIALLTARVRSKELLTTVILIAFFAAYSALVSKMGDAIAFIMENGAEFGNILRDWVYPFYISGLACGGDLQSLAISAVIWIGVFVFSYLVLSFAFLRIVTTKRGERKLAYKEKRIERSSALAALLRKESKRFLQSAMIFFNTSIGSLMFLLLCVVAAFNMETVQQINGSGFPKDEIAVILAIVFSFIATSNLITASSVSLEGECLWIVRASPAKTSDIFTAKILLQVFVTLLPAAVATVLLCVLLAVSWEYALLVFLCVAAITALCSVAGLAINLKLPNLTWTNEIAAVKQSLSPLVTMFLGWGAAALALVPRLTFAADIPAAAYLWIFTGMYAAVAVGIAFWIYAKGKGVFENL